MTSRSHLEEPDLPEAPIRRKRWLALLGAVFGLSLVLLLLGSLLWHTFFHYVPPGHMLVITAKNGDPLEAGQVLAKEGQKGIQETVLGEGWHYVTPIIYTTELKQNFFVRPGNVGIVTALGGK